MRMKSTRPARHAAHILSFRGAPKDRLPGIPADQLTEAQRDAADRLQTTWGTPVSGPFVPLLRSPGLMLAAGAMGHHLHATSTLPPRISELVILITARHWKQEAEWRVHHPIALAAGLDPAIVQAVEDGRKPRHMGQQEAAAWAFATELHRTKAVSEVTYAGAVAAFGEAGAVDLAGLSGYYTLLAMVAAMAQTPPPARAERSQRAGTR